MFWRFYMLLPLLLLIGLISTGFSGSTAAAPGAQPPKELVTFATSNNAPDPNETLRYVNQLRLTHGLPELKPDTQLGLVASARAADMVARQYYAHKNPDGSYYYDYFKNYGVTSGYSCENLDLIFVPNQDQIMGDWLASTSGHQECMMHPKTNKAGYAAVRLTLINFDGSESAAYIIVAVHSQGL